jgi:hypothetical protein
MRRRYRQSLKAERVLLASVQIMLSVIALFTIAGCLVLAMHMRDWRWLYPIPFCVPVPFLVDRFWAGNPSKLPGEE